VRRRRLWSQGRISKTKGLRWATLTLCVALVVGACGDNQMMSRDSDTGEGALEARVKKGVKPKADTEVAVIETADYGKIVIELYPNIAPNMVARFKQLVNEGFYNGTAFHRVNPVSGLIQGGDPFSKGDDTSNYGKGDSPYPNVAGEFSDLPYERGTVGAARKGEGPGLTETQALDTANCQFFITLKRQSAFDKQYTIFGRVIEGINNADIIAGAPVVPGTERPADKIVIKSITLRKQ
jgi:cyclophilin family peptidyl-prolyl cis-trans isomerase